MTTVRELADQAGQAIRAANHHTITPHGDMSVPDLYRVVGELGYLTRCLDQLLHQLSHNLCRRTQADELRHDTGADPIEAITEAVELLLHAARQAGTAAHALDAALNPLSHVADPAEDLNP